MTDLHVAHHLLRCCLDACKVTHLLRASDCYTSDAGVRDAEMHILTGFEDIIGQALPGAQRVQVGLPLSVGGCGVRSPLTVRPAARLAALVSFFAKGADQIGLPQYTRQVSATLVTPVLEEMQSLLGPNFDPLAQWIGSHASMGSASGQHLSQRWWSQALGTRAMNRLLDSVSPRDQARLLEQQNGVGTAFMAVTPSNSLHTTIPSDLYRLGLKWWLGLPLIGASEDPVLCPGCGSQVDEHGDHLLCCPRNNYSKRHNALQECLANILTESGQGFATEVQVPNCPDAQLRPADLLLRAWDNGADTAVDLTVCHGWQVSERGNTVSRERWRTFLTRKERAKHAKYDVHCRRAHWSFAAMAFGTFGGTGPEAARVLHRVLKRAACWLEGDLRASKQEELRLSMGLTLMRHIWLLLEAKNYL